MSNEKTVPCKHCGEPTMMLGTKLCDRCWEIDRRVSSDPEMALKILGQSTDFVERLVKEIISRVEAEPLSGLMYGKPIWVMQDPTGLLDFIQKEFHLTTEQIDRWQAEQRGVPYRPRTPDDPRYESNTGVVERIKPLGETDDAE